MKKNKYLSKEYTNCLRGIFAILVVLHHLYLHTEILQGTFLGAILKLSGALSVAVFFFFSGYGLTLSSNKKNYIQTFFRNRFLPLYCFYIVLVILYSLWTLLLEKSISPQQVVQSLFFGSTVVTNGWYMQATFVMYLLFWLIFNFFKSTNTRIILLSIASLAYFALCFFSGLGAWWYQSIFCFVFGMVYCYKKDIFDTLLEKFTWPIFISTVILFVIFVLISNVFAPARIAYLLLFVCVVLSLSYILCDTPIINNLFFSLCGKYSLEIYVTHGLFLRLIWLNITENKLIYILTVIIGTVIMSVIMKIVYTKIVKLISIPNQRNYKQ